MIDGKKTGSRKFQFGTIIYEGKWKMDLFDGEGVLCILQGTITLEILEKIRFMENDS